MAYACLNTIMERSVKKIERYHKFELQHHRSEWTVEGDA
jgi:hypothetical protein